MRTYVQVSDLLADPSKSDWMSSSIEFCGGIHLEHTGEAKAFVITGKMREGEREGGRESECYYYSLELFDCDVEWSLYRLRWLVRVGMVTFCDYHIVL